MAGPGMFVGRIDELRTIEQCLFQAKNANPQHFLVQGERGIGKSSLLFYVEHLAKGTLEAFTGVKFRFLVVSVDLGGCANQVEIVRKIGRGLRQSLNDHQMAKEAAKEFLDWLLKWEVLGVKFHKDQLAELDTEQVADDLVGQFVKFCRQSGDEIDGVLILIDEADRPGEEAGLGELLKLLSERLTKRECSNVLFGVAGLPSVLVKLRNSHESSPRLFETMLLEPLELDERKEVVSACLADAKRKNGVETKITAEAMEFLVELSEGYPHFLHQFGYSAFAQDKDDEIDVEDVGEGAFKDGGALTQLGDKFFNEMYHARISSEDYRRVLDAMAAYGDRWVARKDIIKESGVNETNVNNALLSLKAKQIIIQDETRRGFYRLPTNSFAAWINAIRSARAKSEALRGDTFTG